MTDSEKLDFLVAEMQSVKTDITGLKADVTNMKTDIMDMKTDIADMKADIKELQWQVNRLESGQLELIHEFRRIDRRVSDSYNLALDAWGQSVENREWLESIRIKSPKNGNSGRTSGNRTSRTGNGWKKIKN